MERPLRHLALHRIAGTELRVVSDVDGGVIPIVEVEEEVIRGYAGRLAWPHRWVTLFILRDLQPVVRHVAAESVIVLGGAIALDQRPVINVYDLANSARCHVFVNQQVMERAGYWGDALATKGLLAHEHAHPLAETPLVQASRRLKVERAGHLREPATACTGAGPASRRTIAPAESPMVSIREPGPEVPEHWRARVGHRLGLLLDTLCIYALRELCANELAIRNGFHEALLHLNRRNIATATRSLRGRAAVVARLHAEVRAGALPPAWEALVLLLGDMEGYLATVLEVAAFDRAGRAADARELEAGLRASVFPALDPEVGVAFGALRGQYTGLGADASLEELVAWGNAVVGIIAAALGRKGLALRDRVVAVA